jgi:hypothetical protein
MQRSAPAVWQLKPIISTKQTVCGEAKSTSQITYGYEDADAEVVKRVESF